MQTQNKNVHRRNRFRLVEVFAVMVISFMFIYHFFPKPKTACSSATFNTEKCTGMEKSNCVKSN